ncbi:MAG: AcpP [Bacillota bacterium]|jgi:acyl carrier protein|nr:AcpP [Bacillota bacterium]
MKRNDVISKIIERCCQLFNKAPEELDENTDFAIDLKAKSGNVSQITTFLEDVYDVEIPFMEFRRKATIGEAADYILELIDEF